MTATTTPDRGAPLLALDHRRGAGAGLVPPTFPPPRDLARVFADPGCGGNSPARLRLDSVLPGGGFSLEVAG